MNVKTETCRLSMLTLVWLGDVKVWNQLGHGDLGSIVRRF